MAETSIPTEPTPTAEAQAEPKQITLTFSLPRLSFRDWAFDFLLILLIAAGAYLRWMGQNWDQNTHLHPDERFMTMVETALQPVDSLGEYFDNSVSTLNPFNTQFTHFVYGQLPFVVVRYVADWLEQTDYGSVHFVGRSMSALTDMLAIAGLYLMGRRLYSHRVGLIAAALSALAVMQIQQSHFFTPDNFGTLFTVLTMYFASLAAQTKRWPYFALAGVSFGLALATRINLLPLFGEILVAAVVAYADEYRADTTGSRALQKAGLALALAGLAALLAFRVAMPMAFGDPGQKTSFFTFKPNSAWLEQMRQAQAENSGVIDAPPGKQWTNRPALLFPLINMVVWGMGLPLGLLAWAGFAWALWQTVRGDWKRHALPLTWAGGYFVFMGTRWVKSVRYFLPIYPFLALFAAWAIVELWRWKSRSSVVGHRSSVIGHQSSVGNEWSSLIDRWTLAIRNSQFAIRGQQLLERWARPLAVAVAIVVLAGTAAWAYAFTRIYTRDYTRVSASKWIYRNLPGVVALSVEDGDGSGYAQVPVGGATVFVDSTEATLLPMDVKSQTTITAITFPHIAASGPGGTPLEITLTSSADAGLRSSANVTVPPAQGPDTRGQSLTATLTPITVPANTTVYLSLKSNGGPITITGPAIANESWDDPLPVSLPGFPGGWDLFYRNLASSGGGEIHPYNEDDENKRQELAVWLDEADYIFVSSQRAMWSLPRLPLRYPLMIEYYQSLFDGSLGFELVSHFQSNPTLGPLHISDVGGLAAWGQDPTLPVYNDNLLSSEEAFSVYDHPPVWVFRKRANYDPVEVRAVLASVDLTSVVRYTPREASRPQKDLMLPAERLAVQRAGGTWSQMFDPDSILNRYQPLGVVAWWLTVVILGWLAFPLAYVALRGLPDGGYAAAKTLALLVIAWLAWVLGSFEILAFTRLTILLCVLVVAGASAALAWPRRAELRDWARTHWKYMLVVELLALALFAFDLLIRWGNSDLWHPAYGGEKPMDFSYFNAVLKSASFPPYDPWFAGGYINYYYFGFVIVAVPTKLLGIVPSFAYNLILPMLFSMVGMGAFAVAYNLVGRGQGAGGRGQGAGGRGQPSGRTLIPNPYVAGLAAALLIVVLGNLGEVQVLSRGLQQVAGASAGLQTNVLGIGGLSRALLGLWRVIFNGEVIPTGTGSWYWDATRIIPPGEGEAGPITEFPFFTFLYADLHAHMIDLPLTLLALLWGVAVALTPRPPLPTGTARSGEGESAAPRRSWVEWGATFALGGLALGALKPTNTWDYPAYLMLGVLAVLFANYLSAGRIDRWMLLRGGIQVVVLVGLTRLLFWPYSRWYGAGYNEAEMWKGSKTTIDSYLYIYGLFFFVMVTLLVRETRRWLAETPATVLDSAKEWAWSVVFVVSAFVAFVAALYLAGYTTAIIIVPLATWAGLLMLRRGISAERRMVFALIGLGLALTSVVELVVLKGDISRMNTVFKFYLQVWVLFSVAAGACLAWVLAELDRWKPRTRGLWLTGLTLLTAGAALYTVMATSAKVRDRMAQDAPRTLDGMTYMRYATYWDRDQELQLANDFDAIRWMQENVIGSPVIVEANTVEYHWGSRFTIYTGLPGVVGWNWHQRQQRGGVIPSTFVTDRVQDIEVFYVSPKPEDALSFIQKYDVKYIVVGDLERAYYTREGLAKFDAMVAGNMLRVAYEGGGGTKVYEVVGNGNGLAGN